MKTRRCWRCKTERPIDAFSPSLLKAGCCRECHAARMREQYANNPNRQVYCRANTRKQYWKNPEESRKKAREQAYTRYWADPEAARVKGREKAAKKRKMTLRKQIEEMLRRGPLSTTEICNRLEHGHRRTTVYTAVYDLQRFNRVCRNADGKLALSLKESRANECLAS